MLRINTSPIMHMKEEGVCIHLCPCLLYKDPLRYRVRKLVSCCHCIGVRLLVAVLLCHCRNVLRQIRDGLPLSRAFGFQSRRLECVFLTIGVGLVKQCCARCRIMNAWII